MVENQVNQMIIVIAMISGLIHDHWRCIRIPLQLRESHSSLCFLGDLLTGGGRELESRFNPVLCL